MLRKIKKSTIKERSPLNRGKQRSRSDTDCLIIRPLKATIGTNGLTKSSGKFPKSGATGKYTGNQAHVVLSHNALASVDLLSVNPQADSVDMLPVATVAKVESEGISQ